jgi:hypothetical protein
MLRARIAALAALLAIPSAMGVQAVGRVHAVDAEAGPTPTVAGAEGEEAVAISAKVQPARATPGEPISITVTVRHVARRPALVGLELYDPAGARRFRRLWDGPGFGLGGDLRHHATWRIPDNAPTGHWTVRTTLLDPGDQLRVWNEPAARIFASGGANPRAWPAAATRLIVRPAPPTTIRGTPTAPPTTAATGDATVPVRFRTLPPGAPLPPGARCAAWVRARPLPERKGMNRVANQTPGHRLGPGFFNPSATDPRAAALAARVDGAFTGTTEEILRWAACKWGVDEDLVRAQAAAESWWRQTTKGDWSGEPASCPPGHRPGADGRPGECPQSYGILQNRYPYERSAWPGIDQSTAMNADTAYAVWRACFEGYERWLNDVERGRQYAPGDTWGCAGRWFSGRWHTTPAEDYIRKVDRYLHDRVWGKPDFQEP